MEAKIRRSVKDAKRRVAIEMLEIKGFPQYGLNYVASLSRWHAMTQMTVDDRRIQEALPLAGDDNMQLGCRFQSINKENT